jgi:hypothetical protein
VSQNAFYADVEEFYLTTNLVENPAHLTFIP